MSATLESKRLFLPIERQTLPRFLAKCLILRTSPHLSPDLPAPMKFAFNLAQHISSTTLEVFGAGAIRKRFEILAKGVLFSTNGDPHAFEQGVSAD
jgi:hypothetical protein